MPTHSQAPDRPQDIELEHVIGEAVRGLPPRRAPSALEVLVMQEIERRLALPWWQMSFAHWPAAARGCFLVANTALIVLAVRLCGWIVSDAPSRTALADAAASSVNIPGAASLKALFTTGVSLVDSLPPIWLYGGLSVIAITYAALFGIGAAAYRTLYVGR